MNCWAGKRVWSRTIAVRRAEKWDFMVEELGAEGIELRVRDLCLIEI